MDDDQNQTEDEISPVGEDGETQGKIEKFKEKFRLCENEKAQYLDGWQRCKADYANFRKEVAEGQKEFELRTTAKIIKELVPVLESMDHARSWIKDLGPIESQFEKVLGQYGLERIGIVGESFDPSKHEAVENVKVAEPEKDNIIIELISAGYVLSGKVLRPAKVKVGIHE